MSRDQPTEQRVGLFVCTDVAQQLRPREQAAGIIWRFGQMTINQGHGLFDAPFLHETRGAMTNDQQIVRAFLQQARPLLGHALVRSEEHTSELQSLMRISYAVFCLKK